MYTIEIYTIIPGCAPEFFTATEPLAASELDETLRVFRKPSMFGSRNFKIKVRKV